MATVPDSPTDEEVFDGDISNTGKTAYETIEKQQGPKRGRGCFGSRQRTKFAQKPKIGEVLLQDGLDSSQISMCSEPSFMRMSSDPSYRRTSDMSSSSTLLSSFSSSIMGSSDPCLGASSTSSSSSSRREVPPLRPSKKNHRRSMSLCPPDIPRPNAIKRASTSSTGTQSSLDSALHALKENQGPNVEEFGEAQSPNVSQRKYVRARRRNSMSCSVPSRPGGLHKSGSMSGFPSRTGSTFATSTNFKRPATAQLCRRNSISSFPALSSSAFAENNRSDDAWMYQVSNKGVESPTKMCRFDSEDLTDHTSSSPGAQSVTTSVCSSRKRGMSEDPSEEPDDLSSIGARRTTYANNIASRSCTPKVLSPLPVLDVHQGTISFAPIEGTNSTKNEFLQRKKHVTDFDSSSDSDDDDSVNSMSEDEDSDSESAQKRDSHSLLGMRSVRGPSLEIVDTEDVLDSMTSVEDVRFLITAIRRQNGSSKTYTVIPPQNWLIERRSKFIEWSEHKLGFSVRQSDPTNSYLVILRANGLATLDLLESAWDMYKATQHEHKAPPAEQKGCTADKPPIILDTTSSMSSAKEKPSSMAAPILEPGRRDATESIVAHLDSLTLNEKDPTMVRHVTIDDNGATSRPPTFELDLSPPPMEAPHRLSVDSRACAEVDLAFIFQEPSPAAPQRLSKRPPKLSFGSVGSIPRRMDITPMNTASATQPNGFDFVTTPLMKQPVQAWGTRPIEGLDWGCSEECDNGIMDAMLNLFDESFAEANNRDISPRFTRTANLQLDLDVDAGSEDENSFDDSDEEADGFTVTEKEMGSNTLEIEVPEVSTNGRTRLRDMRRRNSSLAKHKRMSVCATASRRSYICQRKPLFDARQSLDPRTHRRDLSTGVDCFMPQVTSREPVGKEQPLLEVLAATLTPKKKGKKESARRSLLIKVFEFLEGPELLTSVSLVCSTWADASTDAYADLMFASVGCSPYEDDEDASSRDDNYEMNEIVAQNSIAQSMEKPWSYLMKNFPYASYLSDGASKSVYKVKNSTLKAPEAVSVMNVDNLEANGEKKKVAMELAVSVMLSSLARRGICPNFVVTRGAFTCPFEPPESHWGSKQCKNQQVHVSTPKGRRRPRQPSAKHRGRFQYIRMELCTKGDIEDYIKEQPEQLVPVEMSRILLFQISFALHAAATKCCLKHYDLKLLNVFLQDAANVPGAKESATGDIVLRYALGFKSFALRMPANNALLAKVADYGTADVDPESNGQPMSLGQLTTLENTPPDFLILGDGAKQGHGHDLFGLGLCMLHMFTGRAPYEEILDDVLCPDFFKEKLRSIWEDETAAGYTVLRSEILAGVFKDDQGSIIEGEPNETFYDTLYRYLVLFGIPAQKFQKKQHGKVWKAISQSLCSGAMGRGRKSTKQFKLDQKEYSLAFGTSEYIARARRNLENTKGGMELLTSLVNFDPDARATAMDVLNSDFFAPLTEPPDTSYRSCDDVRSFLHFC